MHLTRSYRVGGDAVDIGDGDSISHSPITATTPVHKRPADIPVQVFTNREVRWGQVCVALSPALDSPLLPLL